MKKLLHFFQSNKKRNQFTTELILPTSFSQRKKIEGKEASGNQDLYLMNNDHDHNENIFVTLGIITG